MFSQIEDNGIPNVELGYRERPREDVTDTFLTNGVICLQGYYGDGMPYFGAQAVPVHGGAAQFHSMRDFPSASVSTASGKSTCFSTAPDTRKLTFRSYYTELIRIISEFTTNLKNRRSKNRNRSYRSHNIQANITFNAVAIFT